MQFRSILLGFGLLTLPVSILADEPLSSEQAAGLLQQAIEFHRGNVGYQGAYLWKYAADLSVQEGEGQASRTSGWTQPPGTPSVGEAYLYCWRRTGASCCLEAAVEAAQALVNSQLVSGGWSSHFDLGQPGRKRYAYRVDGVDRGRNNLTTFDDNKSQSAVMLLMHVDEALQFQDPVIHEAVEYALNAFLKAQYPNGAWPQQYAEPPAAEQYPVVPASYPDTWPRTYPKRPYIGYYTLNDANMSHIVTMLLEAHRIYDRADCYDAAKKTGDFFLLAQMPDPQPGWAQQYNHAMHPVWARKFEPPAVTGGESQAVMRTLMTIYQHTGDRKYIESLPSALAYYRRSLLADGKLGRFYELKTNRPLYFTRDYELTYDDSDMPTHYAFKVSSKLDSIERQLQKLQDTPPQKLRPVFQHVGPLKKSATLQKKATAVAALADDRGAWVESGTMRHQTQPLPVLDMKAYIANLRILADWAGAK